MPTTAGNFGNLLTNLDGGGDALLCAETAELDDVGPFDPQKWQEQGPVDEKQRGKNATTPCIAEARSIASNSFWTLDLVFEGRQSNDDVSTFLFAGPVATVVRVSWFSDMFVWEL